MGKKPMLGRRILVLLLLAWTSACATAPGVSLPQTGIDNAPAPAAGEPCGWWYARFRLAWPEGSDPNWYLDPLLAREVVAPVLAAHQEAIRLWRFHRRARRDNAGHQFSFIFYAPPATAEKVFQDLRNRPELEDLLVRGRVQALTTDPTDRVRKPKIEDTSDPSWSLPLQQSWPYFIMGVSRSWLDLLDRLATASPQTPFGGDREARYRALNERLTGLWQQEGGHAYIHHLNALFGYEPTFVYEKRLMAF